VHAHADLAAWAAQAPDDGILSRTVHQDEHVKVVWFGFGPGEELSEHTASMPAIVHVLDGEGTLVLGGEPLAAVPGTWVHMAAGLRHALKARTKLVMLLTLVKGGRAAKG
jgi:quercetin dioxygenase-like cupin family protein